MSDTVSALLCLRRDLLAAVDMALDQVGTAHEPSDLKAARLVMLDLYERCRTRGKGKDAETFLRCAQLITAELA